MGVMGRLSAEKWHKLTHLLAGSLAAMSLTKRARRAAGRSPRRER